jgi:hypothetical protein
MDRGRKQWRVTGDEWRVASFRLEVVATPPGVSEVWQGKDLREGVFGSVAMAGLTGEFSDLRQGKDLGDEHVGTLEC